MALESLKELADGIVYKEQQKWLESSKNSLQIIQRETVGGRGGGRKLTR